MKSIATSETTANIAVIKYWGRRNDDLVLPTNSSLSFTMDEQLKTRTSVMFSDKLKEDELWLNNKKLDTTDPELKNRLKLLDAVRAKAKIKSKALIVSVNCFPTAAGFASSAAGFAALACSATKAAGLKLTTQELSTYARRGSGSASRSVFGGFVEWKEGKQADGSDSIAVQVANENHWPELRNIVVVVDAKRKKVSSWEGMGRTIKTSRLFSFRPTLVQSAVEETKKAVLEKDFSKFAKLVMQDSNNMHAVMLDSYPPIMYLDDTSKEIIYKIHEINEGAGEEIAAYTFDAGPNAHVYTTKNNVERIVKEIKKIKGVKQLMVCSVGGGPKYLTSPKEQLIDPATGKRRKVIFDQKKGKIRVK